MNMTYRMAVMEDVDLVMTVMNQTVEAMTDKTLYMADDREFVKKHISDEGEIILAVAPDNPLPAGFLILRYPKESEDNLGRDIGLTGEALLKVVHMESAAVALAFRGQGLMRKLIFNGEKIAAGKGYIYGMCTVSPQNPWSLSNMQTCGYKIKATVPKYGGVMRHILIHQLNSETMMS